MSIATTNPVVQNAIKAQNAEPYDGMVIDAYKKSFADGAKKILEGIVMLRAAKVKAIAHFPELKNRDSSFAEVIDDLIEKDHDVRTLIGKI